MGRRAGAHTVHEAFAPLTKKVIRMPVSLRNFANAATTAVLQPSSTVQASWSPLPGRR
jgi:hypothetical protein